MPERCSYECVCCLKHPLTPTPPPPFSQQVLGDADHPLLVMVRECLSNVVDRRPTAAAILSRIGQLNQTAEDDLMAMDKLHMIEQLQRVQGECEELQVSICHYMYKCTLSTPTNSRHVGGHLLLCCCACSPTLAQLSRGIFMLCWPCTLCV